MLSNAKIFQEMCTECCFELCWAGGACLLSADAAPRHNNAVNPLYPPRATTAVTLRKTVQLRFESNLMLFL